MEKIIIRQQYRSITINIIEFISLSDVPLDQKVTYDSFVTDHFPSKVEQWRIPLVVGKNKLSYYEDTGSLAINLAEIKIFFNSVISNTK